MIKKIWDFLTITFGLLFFIFIFFAIGIEFPPVGLAMIAIAFLIYLYDRKDEKLKKENKIKLQKIQDNDQSASKLVKSAEFYERGGHSSNKNNDLGYYELDFSSESFRIANEISFIEKKLEVKKLEENKPQILSNFDDEWAVFKRFMLLCESEPEKILLKALIKKAELKPDVKKLKGQLQVVPQARLLRFRVDFLVNDHLVVEVDGKAYHSNDSSFEKDRLRDQELLLAGYKTIRFPASQVYRSPLQVAEIVMKVAKNS